MHIYAQGLSIRLHVPVNHNPILTIIGPMCGLTAFHELKECKWLELREKLLRKKR
jgi:hypothetical protein